ncbi:MAG TPA: hypothetical protein VLJ83_07100 [Gemmatimonadaceae bacterium]|nr:hypothetical protein [Gemmatimonadaceae bacterium]
MATSDERQIEQFLSKYTPEMVAAGKAARARMRKRMPGGLEFVYDNYNALVFGFGPNERPSDAVLSLALMPKWVTLCFLKGAKLADPKKVLRGSGSTVRHVRLERVEDLDDPYISDLIERSIQAASPAYAAGRTPPRTIIKSISAKQRPRRPSTKLNPRKTA